MAKLKMVKYPKKPKLTASVPVKERYLKRISEIDKENRAREAKNKRSESLSKRISGIRK